MNWPFRAALIPLFVAGLLPIVSEPASATTFEVGDGQPYPEIGDVPWEGLLPGDTVRIHHRATPYREKWVICRAGTEAEPIVISGVPSPSGDLPVIEGIDATTREELNYWNESRGVIKIGGANNPPDTMPAHIVIENLEIRSGRPPYTFTGRDGLTSYASNSAAIYIEKGEHLRIRNCVLWDCGNGLFCGSATTDLVVEYNHIHTNGIEGSIYEHNNYTEALGVLFQFNRFGPLRDGCLGNNLKDRSAGAVVRYNWIESGNRQLDLVDSGDPDLYNDPSYAQTLVYGNVLIEPDGAGNSQIIHYGGDSGDTSRYRGGTLYLHNNTVVSTRSGNTTLLRLSSASENCDARNNLVYVTAAGSRLAILAESGGTVDLQNNWLKSGWVTSHGSTSGQVFDLGNVEGSDPGFTDLNMQEFTLLETSSCVDAGGGLASEIATEHTPVFEYVRHSMSQPRPADGSLDIGAFEYALPSSVDGAGPDRNQAQILAYPNPSSDRVTFEAQGPASPGSSLSIYGANGRLVKQLSTSRATDVERWTWDGTDVFGRAVPRGIYFARLDGAEAATLRSVVIVR